LDEEGHLVKGAQIPEVRCSLIWGSVLTRRQIGKEEALKMYDCATY
jgi:hypothetical protein